MLMRHMKHQVAGEYAWYSAQAQCRTHFYTLWQREGEGGATSPQTPGAPQNRCVRGPRGTISILLRSVLP